MVIFIQGHNIWQRQAFCFYLRYLFFIQMGRKTHTWQYSLHPYYWVTSIITIHAVNSVAQNLTELGIKYDTPSSKLDSLFKKSLQCDKLCYTGWVAGWWLRSKRERGVWGLYSTHISCLFCLACGCCVHAHTQVMTQHTLWYSHCNSHYIILVGHGRPRNNFSG